MRLGCDPTRLPALFYSARTRPSDKGEGEELQGGFFSSSSSSSSIFFVLWKLQPGPGGHWQSQRPPGSCACFSSSVLSPPVATCSPVFLRPDPETRKTPTMRGEWIHVCVCVCVLIQLFSWTWGRKRRGFCCACVVFFEVSCAATCVRTRVEVRFPPKCALIPHDWIICAQSSWGSRVHGSSCNNKNHYPYSVICYYNTSIVQLCARWLGLVAAETHACVVCGAMGVTSHLWVLL